MSLAQERFWHLHALEPDSPLYNISSEFRLRGLLDEEALRRAVARIVERHSVLRSRFASSPHGPTVSIAEDVTVEITHHDLTSILDDAEREHRMMTLLEETAGRPIDLVEGPPFHLDLIELAASDHALQFTAHATVWDGPSADVFLRELAHHYEVEAAEGAPDLPELPTNYQRYAQDQRRRLDSGELDRSLEYWRHTLLPPPCPVHLSRKGVAARASHAGARIPFRIEGELFDAVTAVAQAARVTTYMLLLAVLEVLIHRYTGSVDMMISTPFQGRTRPEYEDLIGVFVNTLFTRSSIDPDASFAALLQSVRAACLEAVQHQDAPSDLVVANMTEGGFDRPPHQVLFVFQRTSERPGRMGLLTVEPIRREVQHTAVDLTVWARQYPDHIDGGFDFRTAIFDEGEIRLLITRFLHLLSTTTEDPQLPVCALPMVSTAETAELQRRADGGAAPERAAVKTAVAIIHSHGVLSRDMVNACLASGDGTPPPNPIIELDGSPDSVIFLLRLARDGNPGLVLEPDLAAEARQAAESHFRGTAGQGSLHFLEVLGSPCTTGRTWESLHVDAAVLHAKLGLQSGETLALYSDVSPAAQVTTILACAANGVNLALPSAPLATDGLELEDWIADHDVRAVIAGSSTLSELIDTGWDSAVETVVCTDPFLPDGVRRDLTDRANAVFIGHSFDAIATWALFADASGTTHEGAMPAAGIRVTVLGQDDQPVPSGVPGRLTIISKRVAPAREFATGERALWTSAGRLVRLDPQSGDTWVLNGQPVDIKQSILVALGTGGVGDAHSTVRSDDRLRRLVLYVCPDDSEVDFGLLKRTVVEACRRALPQRETPAQVIVTAHIPRNASGTVNLPLLAARESSPSRHSPPQTSMEREIARIWTEVLGIASITISDKFFELGGHSLQAVQVTAQMRRELGLRIAPRDLFFHTLGSIATAGLDALEVE
jgi:non-ribosomal peptide synthetase component F/acyl carrier protein